MKYEIDDCSKNIENLEQNIQNGMDSLLRNHTNPLNFNIKITFYNIW